MKSDYKWSYITEISEYIGKIENIINNIDIPEDINLGELQLLVKKISGTARVIGFDFIQKFSKGIIDFLEDIINNEIKVNDKHIKLIKMIVIYYNHAIQDCEKDQTKLSYDKLFEAFKVSINSDNIDFDYIYQTDVLNRYSDYISKSVVAELDNQRVVEVKLNRIDSIINKLNDIVLNQHQLKNEIERIKESEFILSRAISNDDSFKTLNPELKDEILKHISALRESGSLFYTKITQSERDTFTLQEEILSFRMLPISLLTDSIKTQIESLAISYPDKKFRIEFSDKTPLIDRYILQKIKQPITNIIENTIEHGVESADIRKSLGKDESTLIKVLYNDSSGKIGITIEDDGAGIDFERLRKKVLNMFSYESDVIEQAKNDDLIKYLFYQRVSTEDDLEKGFGLYEALQDIEQLKGSIALSVNKNKGVTVSITVPKSLTTVNGFFIRSSGEKFLIPSAYIKEIVYVEPDDVIDLLTKYAIKLRNDIVPIYPLSGILKSHNSKTEQKLHVIVVEDFGEKIGIIVDEVLYHSSVIFKPLPQNLEKLKVLQGVVFDENHEIINILYIPEIIKRLKNIRSIEFRERYSKENLKYKNILVIDDSSINRDILKNIIKNIDKNINVDTAPDGIDALDMIRNKFYDMIVTDSNMVKMDGITFIENFRKEERYRVSPVIVIASSDEKDMIRRLKALGVDDIYYKSRFDRDQLVDSVKRYLSGTNG